MFDFSNAGSTCRLWNDVPEVGNGVLAFTEQDPHSSIFVRTSFCDGEAHATDPASHYGARAVLAVPLIDGAEVSLPLPSATSLRPPFPPPSPPPLPAFPRPLCTRCLDRFLPPLFAPLAPPPEPPTH